MPDPDPLDRIARECAEEIATLRARIVRCKKALEDLIEVAEVAMSEANHYREEYDIDTRLAEYRAVLHDEEGYSCGAVRDTETDDVLAECQDEEEQ